MSQYSALQRPPGAAFALFLLLMVAVLRLLTPWTQSRTGSVKSFR